MILLEKHDQIMPKADKTNIVLPFDVPAQVKALQIEYQYTPKTCENEQAAVELIKKALAQYGENLLDKDPYHYLPVNNLVTLSLDSPAGYRGAAHRQPNKQFHHISAAGASPGFLPGVIDPGRWQVVLNVHCAACPIQYTITVTGEESA